jgi:hypothetical protein
VVGRGEGGIVWVDLVEHHPGVDHVDQVVDEHVVEDAAARNGALRLRAVDVDVGRS